MKKCAVLLLAALLAVLVFAGCREMGGMARDYGNVSRTDDGEVNGTNATEGIAEDLLDDMETNRTERGYTSGRTTGTTGTTGWSGAGGKTDSGTTGRSVTGQIGGTGLTGSSPGGNGNTGLG